MIEFRLDPHQVSLIVIASEFENDVESLLNFATDIAEGAELTFRPLLKEADERRMLEANLGGKSASCHGFSCEDR